MRVTRLFINTALEFHPYRRPAIPTVPIWRPFCRLLHTTHIARAEHGSNSSSPDMTAVLQELSKNPKAMAIFQAIQRDPRLLNEVQSLGLLLHSKGFIDPSNPVKQPGPLIMMRMFADGSIRSKMLNVAKLLTEAGALDANGKPVDMANVMQIMMGGSPPPPEAVKRLDGEGSEKGTREDEGLGGKIKGFFKK
ncbi:uncharacterized protein SPPG_01797 [Spizellomyces punctatus DAOM BR117]|uniref:Uncharacterized protein n=1 Tax=Spizellomyces punctatus (strain DAOM BR117) TaxID=645134 RepID=A0A0L0HPJ2_SPIPD|nr:uncharacterized protein SPPG_01797 [Spizellomyces punctatus DAOM BR117]KND02714.1 hypothetical protein SPPG_01797 [Spizellomyces punctatus DAOM BR117]|eukprot:XP_016610753.1 hypothetical protein SPPG_01797 [Spizellomyces punctatus DAOM BR117]